MARRNSLLIGILMLPVIISILLGLCGLKYGQKQYVFENLGQERYNKIRYGQIIVTVPRWEDDGVVWSYQPMYQVKKINPEGKIYVSFNSSPYADQDYEDSFDYKQLTERIEKYVQGDIKARYLAQIKEMRFSYALQKIIGFIPWDVYTLIGIWLAFLVIFSNKGLVQFVIWSWYACWKYIGAGLFHCVWKGVHSADLFTITKFIFNPAEIYFENAQMLVVEFIILLGVPMFHLLRIFGRFLIEGVSDYFAHIEQMLNFNIKNKKNRRCDHAEGSQIKSDR